MRKIVIKPILALFVLLFSAAGVGGNQEGITTRITEVFTDPSLFGGCGAYLEAEITLPACRTEFFTSRYVMFDCLNTSTEVPRSVSNRNLNQAQLAMITGYNAYVLVDDGIVLNGVCFANRVNVLHPDRTD